MLVADAGYEFIRNWLSEQSGMSFPEKKRDLLTHRMTRVLGRFGLSSLEALAEELISDRDVELKLAVLHAASTNHTYFFREPEVLDFFRDNILTPVARDGSLRIWSAAASSGDEAYSLAIMAAEMLGALAPSPGFHSRNRYQSPGDQPSRVRDLHLQPSGARSPRDPRTLLRPGGHGPIPGRAGSPPDVHIPPAEFKGRAIPLRQGV